MANLIDLLFALPIEFQGEAKQGASIQRLLETANELISKSHISILAGWDGSRITAVESL